MLSEFVSNIDLLQEDSRVDDLFDFTESVKKFSDKLDVLKKNTIVGLVGKFGSGKSTMLYQIQKEREQHEDWINFDAWKYPERRDLWEGLIMDVAEQVGDINDIIDEIEGKNVSSTMLDISGGFAGKLIPGIDKLFEIFKSPPAKRVFQLQNILTKMLNKLSARIYVVVEDIDRSGDSGVYFLETLKQFLQRAKLEKIVIVIVPISDKNFDCQRESFLKCLDFKEDFKPEFKNFTKFVDFVFDKRLFEGGFTDEEKLFELFEPRSKRKTQIVSFLQELVKAHFINIREVKKIIKSANQNFSLQCKDGLHPTGG